MYWDIRYDVTLYMKWNSKRYGCRVTHYSVVSTDNTESDIERGGSGLSEEYKLGDVIKLKKAHPCGANAWEILRVGMDFRLKCTSCGHLIMIPRKDVVKNFRGFILKDTK